VHSAHDLHGAVERSGEPLREMPMVMSWLLFMLSAPTLNVLRSS